MKSALLALAALVSLPVAAHAGDITYNLDFTFPATGSTVTGTIVTDGSLGIIGAGDLVSLSLTYDLFSGNEIDTYTDDSVSATGPISFSVTATEITFDFENPDPSSITLSDNNSFLCIGSAGGCGQFDGNVVAGDGDTEIWTTAGSDVVATSATPEPSSLALLATGLLALGATLRRNRKRRACAILGSPLRA